MLSCPRAKCHKQGVVTLTRKVVGQIINIVDSDSYSTVTIETAAGDITHLRYDKSASGLEPAMGVICTVTYNIIDDYLLVVEIRRPKPGEYRSTYEDSLPPEPPAAKERSHKRPASESPIVEDISHSDDDSFFPSTYPSFSKPYSSKSTAPSSASKPRKTSRDRVPDGILVITMSYLVAGLILIVIPIPITILLGVFFLIAALGMYFYQPWAHTITSIICILFAVTIIGLILAIPLWNYLNRKDIKQLYEYD